MNLYKISFFFIVLFYNISCDGYYKNDKNPFKASEICDDDKYSYNKMDLADESFGKIGVVSSSQEYPRAGIDNASFENDKKVMKINGSFHSLCQSSIIDKVKLELHNGKSGMKTYYPDIRIGYLGNFTHTVDFNKNNSDRCFFKNSTLHIKAWARDEDGNTFYANNNLVTHKPNVKSDISWDARYEYRNRSEYENETRRTERKILTEYKDEEREIWDTNWTYTYRYDYIYDYRYTYADKYIYKFPVKIFAYANNDYSGEYFKMITYTSFGGAISYPITNTNRQIGWNIGSNSDIKEKQNLLFKISFMEKLPNCEIQSKIITKRLLIPEESLNNIFYNQLTDTEKILLDTRKTYVSRVRRD